MQGWEGQISINENTKGWEQSEILPGRELWVDSEGLVIGQKITERDDKILHGRMSKPSSYSADQIAPNGPVAFQPRAEETMLSLMAHFQAVDFEYSTVTNGGSAIELGTITADGYGTGTFTFTYVNNSPTWSGSNWGTVAGELGTANSIYPVSLLKHFGWTISGSNCFKFENGVIDPFEITQEYGEDLVFNPTFKFYTVAATTINEANFSTFSIYASSLQYVDWKGTLTFSRRGSAATLNISKYSAVLNQGVGESGKIGKLGFYKFPLQGRPVVEISLDLDFEDSYYLNDMMQGDGTCAASMRWENSVVDWLEIEHNTLKYRPFDVPIPGGQGAVTYTLPFRAYMSEDGTTPILIKVCKVFGTEFLSLHTGSGY